MNTIGNKLTSKEWNELEKYIKFLVYKISQVIVQSRFGGKYCNIKKKQASHDWFNLSIEDNTEIQASVKDAYSRIQPFTDFCICTEILLKTSDGDTLVLEAWCVSMNTLKNYSDSSVVGHTSLASMYCRMSVLLKSIIAVTRITPAFKLSDCQSADAYAILYRIYPGQTQTQELGKLHTKNEIGQVLTPVGTIKTTLSFRSKDNLTITPRKIEKDTINMMKNDYFTTEFGPNVSRKSHQEINTDDVSLKTSSDFRKMGAFALPNGTQDLLFPELDMLQQPFLNLTRRHMKQNDEMKDMIENADKNANMSQVVNEEISEVDYNCNSNAECYKNEAFDDFFTLQKKPPFADCDGDNDIGAFFRECQSAPPLASFTIQPTLEEQVSDIETQLVKFETCMTDFDKFVESICHIDLAK